MACHKPIYLKVTHAAGWKGAPDEQKEENANISSYTGSSIAQRNEHKWRNQEGFQNLQGIIPNGNRIPLSQD